MREVAIHGSEKSDIISRRALCDYKYSDQIVSVQVLYLDVDFDSVVLEVIALLFPNVHHLTSNFGRVCCSCPEIVVLECVEIPPMVQDSVLLNSNENGIQPSATSLTTSIEPIQQPPAGDGENEQQPQLPMPPEETRIIEEEVEDNCEVCSEKAMLTLARTFTSLHKLSITGPRCKDSAIKAMEYFKHYSNNLTCVVFASCVNYSLKHLLNVCYILALELKQQQQQSQCSRSSRTMKLKINNEKFRKIIKLTKKPNNLFVENIDPIVDDDNDDDDEERAIYKI